MVDMYQELRVKMFSDKPMEKPVINQVQDSSTEELMNPQTLNIKHFLRVSMSITQTKNMKLLLKLLEFKDNKIHTKR